MPAIKGAFPPQEAREIPAFSVHLDAIRALSALVVFLGHARQLFLASSPGTPSDVSRIAGAGSAVPMRTAVEHTSRLHAHFTFHTNEGLAWGHQSVIVFFVLSGFLVGGSVLRDIRRDRWSWSSYLLNRFARLWMVLLPALLLGWCFDSYGLAHFTDKQSIYDSPPGQTQVTGNISDRLGASVLIGNALFLQSIFFSHFGTNAALWSLTYEFWYYIAFPFLALAILDQRNRGRVRLLYALACVSVLLLVGSVIATYFLIWLVGVLASLVPLRIAGRRQKTSALVASVFFIGLNVALLHYSLNVIISDLILSIGFLALLYCLLHLRQPARPGLYQRTAQFSSRMSYTLYLVHLPALVLGCAILLPNWHRLSITLPHLAQFSLVLACVLGYAVLVYFCFEAHTAAVRQSLKKAFAMRGTGQVLAGAAGSMPMWRSKRGTN